MSGYKYDSVHDVYCYKDTGVLINKLGIHSAEKLEEAERRITALRLDSLARGKAIGRFGFSHLKSIHRVIFGDIYPWAGEPRRHGFISKSGTIFCRGEFIEQEAQRIFDNLARESKLKGLAVDQFTSRLAYYAAEINVLHPFREGNGRAAREFIRQLSVHNGYNFMWQRIPKDSLLKADIEAFERNYAPLEALMRIAVEKN